MLRFCSTRKTYIGKAELCTGIVWIPGIHQIDTTHAQQTFRLRNRFIGRFAWPRDSNPVFKLGVANRHGISPILESRIHKIARCRRIRL